MKFLFSWHSKQRLRERRIKVKDVKKVVLSPDWYQPAFRDRIQVRKKVRKKILEVIYIEQNGIITIITAYYL